jgi:hypothetical protein
MLSQSFTHDNNLFRTDQAKVSDTISSTQVRAGLDKYLGRQHYGLSGQVSKAKYKNYSSQNYTGYQVDGDLQSEIGSDIRIGLTGYGTQSLRKAEDSQSTELRNIQKGRGYNAEVRYGLYGRMSVNAGLGSSSLTYRVTNQDDRNIDQYFAGLRYSPSDLLFFGLNLSHSSAEYKNKEVFYLLDAATGAYDTHTGENVDSNSVSLTSQWVVTGFSVLQASMGYTQERKQYDRNGDFNGVTGSATWVFTPQGKLSYTLSWSRDTNNMGGYTGFDVTKLVYGADGSVTKQGYSKNVSSDRVTNNFNAKVRYQMTSKMTMSLGALYSASNESVSSVDPFNSARYTFTEANGKYHEYTLSGSYRPIDALELGCSAQSYDRAKSIYYRQYKGRTLGCYASFTLQ